MKPSLSAQIINVMAAAFDSVEPLIFAEASSASTTYFGTRTLMRDQRPPGLGGRPRFRFGFSSARMIDLSVDS